MMGSGPCRARLADGRRVHFQHGPIDLVLEAFGDERDVGRAYDRAWQRFQTILPELVSELGLLRTALDGQAPVFEGPVAGRMAAACWPHRRAFVTPMAAVAGAVADEVLAAMCAGDGLVRAYINNGGDIALYLRPGERFETGIVSRIEAPGIDGIATIDAASKVRGIATSGRGGRSFSLGIADSVTVLASSAAAADVAATLIANAVNVDHPAIERRPALELDPDSDLGERAVTVAVGALEDEAAAHALDAGATAAAAMRRAGLAHAALLTLSARSRMVGAPALLTEPQA
jgi:ApbE superfamily uncharacterized protein (UPF0280 family)